MIKRILLFLLATNALVASASTITFQPTSQNINLGQSTTVDVYISGLSANQALGAFDLFVLNNSAIITPTGVTFFSNLGDPGSEFTATGMSSGSTEAAEISDETTATLLGLQTTQPFSLFELTYMGVGAGTSSLTLGPSEYLADGDGVILPDATVIAGSITVVGGTQPPSPTPEPSTLALLSSGVGALGLVIKRRRLI